MSKTPNADGSVTIPAKLYDKLRNARKMQADWAAVEKAARDEIEEMMGESERAVVRGQTVVNWPHTKSTRFDQKAHSAEKPECHASYMTPSAGRRFAPVD